MKSVEKKAMYYLDGEIKAHLKAATLDLTIALPVRNEEKNLKGCLEAIGSDLAKHIIIIDSGSTDNTITIAKDFGAEVVGFEWNGKFPKKRNWFLRTYPLKTKWVMFLDADEYLTEAFKKELKEALNKKSDEAGFWLSYTVYFLGKKLIGGYPLRKLALFRVGAGEYEKIDEDQWSKLDMEVHEHPILNGKVGVIKSKIDHYDFRGVSHYVLKHNEYASWEAERFLKDSKNRHLKHNWTWKQRLKYRLMKSAWIGPTYFIGSFIFLGGFLDGARGFSFAVLKMSYFIQVHCKIQELENKL